MSKKIFAGIFITFLGSLFIMNIVGEDAYFSEQENRVLTQKPEFTWERFVSGKFTTQFEKYISDQFPWKNGWVGVKTTAEKAIGKKENNGVLFGDDGYLLERFTERGEQFGKNIELVNSFMKRTNGVKTYMLLTPTAVGVYPEKLPRFATSLSQQDVLEQARKGFSEEISFIDVYSRLVANKEETLYFKTDHHWTMRGAYFAYVAAAKEIGFHPLAIDDFRIETVSKEFHGTLYSKANAYDAAPDNIELFIPKKPIHISVTYEDGKSSDSLFAKEFLDKKDKYAVFLGGNHSLVKIKTDMKIGRKLLVLKDSYAHAFIPFLANHFDEIHVIDLRYFKQDIRLYLETNNIKELLYQYNLPNFTTDPNLIWLKQGE